MVTATEQERKGEGLIGRAYCVIGRQQKSSPDKSEELTIKKNLVKLLI
jgi:hypothetical protein